MTAHPALRLRQICLLARDLEWTSSLLGTAFDAPVVFRDPRMAAGGNLTNTHIRLGDSFLETVCPSDLAWRRGTTQTRLLDRNGDCGYMAIVQVPDVAAASRSMAEQGTGTGIVAGDWNVCPGAPGTGLAGVESGRYALGEALPKDPGTVAGINVQFHPRDFGTLAEIQENWPGQGDFPAEQGHVLPGGKHMAEHRGRASPRRRHHGVRGGGNRAPGSGAGGDLPALAARLGGGVRDRSGTPGDAATGGRTDHAFRGPDAAGRHRRGGRGPVGGAGCAQEVRHAVPMRRAVEAGRSALTAQGRRVETTRRSDAPKPRRGGGPQSRGVKPTLGLLRRYPCARCAAVVRP